jgi:hypothetical protein
MRPTTASRHCTPALRRANLATRAVGPRKTCRRCWSPRSTSPYSSRSTECGRKITKREAVITQLVNLSAGANLRATKMLIDMMKDVEKKTGAEPPLEPHRFAPADKEVIKGIVERIRGALLKSRT